MEFVGLLFTVAIKSLVLMVPLTVSYLALRRLILSKTSNAWLYAASALLAGLTTAGLVPWAIGFAQANWLFFVLAAFMPAIWLTVVTVCSMYGASTYGDAPEDLPRSKTIVLENPDWPDAPVPVFRHRANVPDEVVGTDEPRGVLAIARDMRGNNNADKRRHPLMLPAPQAALKAR